VGGIFILTSSLVRELYPSKLPAPTVSLQLARGVFPSSSLDIPRSYFWLLLICALTLPCPSLIFSCSLARKGKQVLVVSFRLALEPRMGLFSAFPPPSPRLHLSLASIRLKNDGFYAPTPRTATDDRPRRSSSQLAFKRLVGRFVLTLSLSPPSFPMRP
jgi:hypothetical protein